MSDPAFDMHSNQTNDWGGKETQVYARFIREMRPDNAASREQNKPMFKSVDMVEIRQIGEKDTFKEPVNDLHKRRFPAAWKAFEAGQEQMQNGTPLAVLFPTNPEVVENLKTSNIFTIEALAAVPDSSGANIPYLTTWKEKASKYIESVEKGKGYHELERQIEDRDLTIMELEDRIKALEAKSSEDAPRRGRPPKQE